MFLVMLGGALGSYARFALGKWIGGQVWAEGFPFGTLIVNVTGSFLLGVAGAIILDRMEPEYQGWFLLIGTGFCGGYTTFSSFEWETLRLVRDGSFLLALGYVGASVVAGFLGIFLGVVVVQLLFPPPQ